MGRAFEFFCISFVKVRAFIDIRCTVVIRTAFRNNPTYKATKDYLIMAEIKKFTFLLLINQNVASRCCMKHILLLISVSDS